MRKEIDGVDRKILCALSENPQLSQAELSAQLKISQPAVSARVRKLEEKGILTRLIGTDIKKAQLFIAKIDISTNQVEQLLKFLDACPLYLNSFLTSGRYNLTALLIGENIRSIMSCVDSHLRRNTAVKSMNFDLIVTPVRSLVVPIKPNLNKKNVTPCGTDCGTCTFYEGDRCLGCPASDRYKGKLL